MEGTSGATDDASAIVCKARIGCRVGSAPPSQVRGARLNALRRNRLSHRPKSLCASALGSRTLHTSSTPGTPRAIYYCLSVHRSCALGGSLACG